MRLLIKTTLTIVIFLNTAAVAAPRPHPVSSEEARHWLDYTVPLPHQISIPSKIVLPANKVAVLSRHADHAVVAQAVRELRDSLGAAGTVTPPSEALFTITLTLDDPQAELLKTKPNADQAGRIFPDSDRLGLRIVALKAPGLYYAAKTLAQLIHAKVTADTVEVPLLNMTDWPEMEDRGLWGADSYNHVAWLADRKMNIIEQISYIGVDKNKKAFGQPKKPQWPMYRQGPRHAIKPVPVVLHLEQVAQKGVFDAWPELRPKGENVHENAICYSQPVFVDVLAGWLVELGSLPGVKSVDVWMAENMQGKHGCQCPQCRRYDRSVLEAKTILAAWNKARRQLPDLGLRILTSEATEDSNQDVFRILPKTVKIWYYHSLLTYTCGESPMLRPYLEKFARDRYWIGVCPNLGMVHFAQPFTSPQFVHYRISEFLRKRMAGLIGYVTPRVHYAAFNVEAAAEWSWNLNGRSPHEFARSWAVRNNFDDPDLFAAWCDTIGPVTWDIYGSDWPAGEQRNVPGKVAKRLLEGTLPELGFVLWDCYRSPWGDIKSVEQLERDIVQARRALELADQLQRPELQAESQIALGYIQSLKALWELKHLVGKHGIAPENRDKAKQYFQTYIDSLRLAAAALPRWEATVRRPGDFTFTEKPRNVIKTMIEEMTEAAGKLGVMLENR